MIAEKTTTAGEYSVPHAGSSHARDQTTSSNHSALTDKVVYLMRGLPSCGKSRRARELAGAMGVICETDEFFFTKVGDRPDTYDYDTNRRQEARDWNFRRFTDAVDAGVSPVAVDRGNGHNLETQRYTLYAVEHGYTVLLAEPDSSWWQEIPVPLKYKDLTQPILDDWSETLAEKNRSTHRTPSRTIRRWMTNWNPNVTVNAILDYKQANECSKKMELATNIA